MSIPVVTRTLLTLFVIAYTLLLPSCKHEPVVPVNVSGNGNGGGGGGGGGNGVPCDPNTVYFQQQILPFIISNCAKSGCHDAASAQDGVILNSYANVMSTGDVEPFNLGDSEIWEVINETDPDKVMPPPGEPPLTQQQINLIGLWITQGAQNLVCDDALGPCDSTNVSYSALVVPILQNKCVGCHTTANSSNKFVNLASYNGVAAVAATGQLYGAITHTGNFTPMPSNGPGLNACEIAKITNWINEGYLNN